MLPLSEMGVWAGRIADKIGGVKRELVDSDTLAQSSVTLSISMNDNIIAFTNTNSQQVGAATDLTILDISLQQPT